MEIMSKKMRHMEREIPVSLREFIGDERLVRWYAQNYDLVGCGPVSLICSDVDPVSEAWMLDKVRPVPIGLDLHTFAEKGNMDRREFKQKTCAQRKAIEELIRDAQPLSKRSLKVVVSFDCSFYSNDHSKDFRTLGRGQLCGLIRMSQSLPK